jgi:prepilin-type N-terminal cleavage/methylation domain-containing protein
LSQPPIRAREHRAADSGLAIGRRRTSAAPSTDSAQPVLEAVARQDKVTTGTSALATQRGRSRSRWSLLRKGIACLKRDQTGFSLIELLVAAAVLSVVLGAVLSVLEAAAKVAPKDEERAVAIGEARAGLFRMTRELRQGTPPTGAPLPTSPSNSLDVIVGGRRVRYACDLASSVPSLRRCVRYSSSDLSVPPGGIGETVIDRVANGKNGDPVFFPQPGGTTVNYFEAKLKVPARGELRPGQGYRYTILLDDGFELRNVSG